MAYKHGVYSEAVSSGATGQTDMNVCPVYVGTLPIQRLNTQGSAFDYSQYINKPMLIKSYSEISKLGIDSSDWSNYTLCEVIGANLLNGNESVAPFIFINVLDPKTHVKQEAQSETINLSQEGTNKVGYIEDPLCIIDDLAITSSSPSLTKSDYSLTYEGDRVKITITKEYSPNTLTLTYKQIDTNSKLTADVFDGALIALDHCELVTGYIPNIIAAPKFSKDPKIHAKIISKVTSLIAEKWRLIAVSDIPASASVKTIDEAISWKKTNAYTSKYDKVCYPMASFAGNIYHLSTLATALMVSTDNAYDGVPYVSPSNKVLNADACVLEDGTQLFMSESEANKLNAVGITTMNIIRRGLRLWGSHMANYDNDNLGTINAEDMSDANIRMMIYMLNYLQYNFIDTIDTPFSRKDVDSVITSVQQWLNSLVNEGKLLFATIEFSESENSNTSMVQGDFVFNVSHTLVPNAKSLTFKVRYTDSGIELLTGGEA